jgi:hypothetical protein
VLYEVNLGPTSVSTSNPFDQSSTEPVEPVASSVPSADHARDKT